MDWTEMTWYRSHIYETCFQNGCLNGRYKLATLSFYKDKSDSLG